MTDVVGPFPKTDPLTGALREVLKNMEAVLDGMEQMTGKLRGNVVDEVARDAAMRLPGAIDRLSARMQWRWTAFFGVVVCVATLLGGAAGYWARGGLSGETCFEKNGGLLCQAWLIPPK